MKIDISPSMENASRREKRRKRFLFNEIFNVIKIYFLLPERRGLLGSDVCGKQTLDSVVTWLEASESIILLTFSTEV